jgi:hypothetical protein
MGNSSTVTLSKSIASPWALMQSFHQCIIRSLVEQLKGQMSDIFRNQEMLVQSKEG